VKLSTRTWVALGICGAATAGAGVLAVVRPGDARAARARPLPPLAGVDTLEVRRGGVATTVRREGGTFTVTAPVRGAADPAAAAAAFAALEALELVAPASERRERAPELGVDASGIEVVATRGGRPLADLIVGKVIEGGTMVRLAPGPAVWRADGDLRAVFDRTAPAWRDRVVARFTPRDATRIAVAARDGARIELAREPGAELAGWRVVSSSVPVDLDGQAPRELVEALSGLTASGFADGVAPARAGLAPPGLVVGVTLADGRTVTVEVGDPAGGHETFVAVPGRTPIFLVEHYDVERFALAPVQFRDRTLCDISDADVIGFAVTHGAASYAVERVHDRVHVHDGWRATRPRGLAVDAEKVAGFATVFRGWRALRLAEHPPADAVSPPRAVIAGRSARSRCTIEVGRELPDGSGYFVRTRASPDVLVVPKWMVDRIAVPLGEIRSG
jgi:hypothetical protein